MNIQIVGNVKGDVKNVSVLENVIGQNEAKNKLAFFLKSNSDKNCLPTFLFSGSQGLGKTYTAYKVAKALGRELIDVNCGMIVTANEFIQKVVIDRLCADTGTYKILLLDEAQKLSYEVCTILLTLLNPNDKHVNYITYNGYNIEWDLSKINVIFATTDAYKLPRALVNRCTEIYFRLYSHDELFNILRSYLGKIKIGTGLRKALAYACRGRARDAYILSTYINRYCDMYNVNVFGVDGWKEVQEVMGLYPYGLKSQEVELLKVISKGFPISLNGIAMKMGLNTSNIEDEIEPRVRELGFVESGTRGRVLTNEGKKYLETINAN